MNRKTSEKTEKKRWMKSSIQYLGLKLMKNISWGSIRNSSAKIRSSEKPLFIVLWSSTLTQKWWGLSVDRFYGMFIESFMTFQKISMYVRQIQWCDLLYVLLRHLTEQTRWEKMVLILLWSFSQMIWMRVRSRSVYQFYKETRFLQNLKFNITLY